MSKTAFIFPGQGAQTFGMGKDFYHTYEQSRQVYDLASHWLGMDMTKLCFEENDRLHLTEYTQAALVVTCLAMEKAVEEAGLKPDVTAGLSLGEYCAVYLAGGMSLRDAITTVRKRGILMERAVPGGQGGMAAVLGMTGETVEKVLGDMEDVSVANYNCPGQIVITGKKAAVTQAGETLARAGAKRVVSLNVSGPFHSSMLRRAGEELALVLDGIAVQQPKRPYVTNVTGEYVCCGEEIKPLLALQISSPVRWQHSVENMIANGVDTFVEIGPGKTLTSFVRKINRDVKVYNIQTVEDVEKTVSRIGIQ